MNFFKNTLSIMIIVFLCSNTLAQSALTPVDSFGTNPGKLKMYSYIPAGISDTVSLVVALHGCTQSAATFAQQTGWNKLADRHKFMMLYPEQQSENNSAFCFNWFDSLYQIKNQMEVLSVKQMIDYMKSHYAFDTSRIYITGLSAGACMTTVMLANYPDMFNKGAIMAGVPFKASKDTSSAFAAMGGSVTKTPGEWSTLVKEANPGYDGSYPDVAIFHGSTDYVVNVKNADELIKQWTDLNNADQIADQTDTLFQGDTAITQIIFKDSLNNDPVVYYYRIKGMGHGIAVDTGSCPRQGGATAAYSIKAHFHSTYWAADFFDLLKDPYSITGLNKLSQHATDIVYSVNNDSGSVYTWSVPEGAVIVSGQGSNSITVNFATNSGVVSAQEMTVDSCENDLATLFVTVLNYAVEVSQTAGINCTGSSTATLQANVTGGAPPYSYNWAPTGGTASVASGLMAGTYTVTVVDSLSASISQFFKIVEPPVISTSQTLTICSGSSQTVGLSKHSTSGTYTDTLTSFKGCDSIVISYLTVSPPKTFNQSFTKCPGDVITVGSTVHASAGVFSDTLKGFDGCDSVVITELILLPEKTVYQTLTVCFGQHITVGTSTHSSNGTYTDVLTSSNGCDSTVITHLIVLEENIHSQSFSICQGQNVRVGSSFYNTNGTYTDMLTSYRGCDSTVITSVTVGNSIRVDQNVTICADQFITVGASHYDKTGTYVDTLQAFWGCDSIVNTVLAVSDPINVNVTIADGVNGVELTASNNAALYQWIKCGAGSDSSVLASSPTYSPVSKGSYAVIVSENLCSDTSACYEVTTTIYTDIVENMLPSVINIYPNPFSTTSTIVFAEEQVNTIVKIFDVLGNEILSMNVNGKQVQIERGDREKGVYLVQITNSDKNVCYRKIIIQ